LQNKKKQKKLQCFNETTGFFFFFFYFHWDEICGWDSMKPSFSEQQVKSACANIPAAPEVNLLPPDKKTLPVNN